MRWYMLLPFTAALAVASTAATSTPAADPPHALNDRVGRAELEPLLRLSGMSDAGIAALRESAGGDDVERLGAARCAVDRALAARPLDIAALDRAMTARDAIQAREAAAHRRRLIGWLRLLDAKDAAILVKIVGTGDGGGPGGAPPPPSGAGGAAHAGAPPGPPPGMLPRRCG